MKWGPLICCAGVAFLALGAAPPTGAKTLDELAAREKVADALETFLDERVCGPIKAGLRRMPADVASPDVALSLEGLVRVSSCGIKPLALTPAGATSTAELAWELEGVQADGQRAVERGSGQATFSQQRGTLRWESLQSVRHQRVQRAVRRFTELPPDAGLELPPRLEGADWEDLFRGGLAVRDLDGDGRPDIVAVTPERAYLFRADGPLHYHREPLGPDAPAGSVYTTAVVGDFDGDGAPDVLLLAAGEAAASCILHNEGGTFTVAGLLPGAGPWHSGIATDLNGDGVLDIVVIPYPRWTLPNDFLEATNGEPPRFFLGDGKGAFREVALPAELQKKRWGLAAVAADVSGRGRREVYVANDFGTKDLWWMDADGGFHESAPELGLTDPGNGMSADVADLRGTGRLDLYVANMFSKAGTRVVRAAEVDPVQKARLEKFARGNTLYLAGSDGGFEERAEALGVNRGLWAFGSIFFDFDDDGLMDIAVADGFLSRPQRKDL